MRRGMAAEVEVPPHSIAAAADVVLKAGQLMAGRLSGEEGEVASGQKTQEAVLVRKRAELVRKRVGQRSRGHSLEEVQCEGERILAQQGSGVRR